MLCSCRWGAQTQQTAVRDVLSYLGGTHLIRTPLCRNSYLLYVNDLFVMGAALIVECLALMRWFASSQEHIA
jgi:hypothetical protein